MEIEKALATKDVEAVNSMLEKNPGDDAVVVNLRVFSRLLTYFPDLFELKGKAVIYKGNTHVYFHNEDDKNVRTKKANKELEYMKL